MSTSSIRRSTTLLRFTPRCSELRTPPTPRCVDCRSLEQSSHPQSFLKTISFFRSCCPRWRKSWPRFPSSAQTSENRTGLRLSLMVEMSRYRSTKSRCRNLTSSGLYCTFSWPMLYRVYSLERYLFHGWLKCLVWIGKKAWKKLFMGWLWAENVYNWPDYLFWWWDLAGFRPVKY